jgi:FkbM family methyltransferase
MTLTQFFLRHNNIYALSRMSGAYDLYNRLINAAPSGQAASVDYEPETTKYITDTLKKGDSFIDCGANTGYFSILAGKLGANVVAFEPVKEYYLQLKQKSAKDKKIKVVNKAVGIKEGKALINFNEAGSTMVGIKGKRTEEIEITTLDTTFPDGLPRLKIIKIDVEGMEKEALEGGKNLIRRHMPDIIFEFNYALLYTKNRKYDEVFDLLRGLGYKKFIEMQTGKPVKGHRELSSSSENILATKS